MLFLPRPCLEREKRRRAKLAGQRAPPEALFLSQRDVGAHSREGKRWQGHEPLVPGEADKGQGHRQATVADEPSTAKMGQSARARNRHQVYDQDVDAAEGFPPGARLTAGRVGQFGRASTEPQAYLPDSEARTAMEGRMAKQPKQPRATRQAPKAAASAGGGGTKNPLVDRTKNDEKDTDDKALKNELIDDLNKQIRDNVKPKPEKEKPEKEKHEKHEKHEIKDHKDTVKIEKIEGNEGVVKDFTREKAAEAAVKGKEIEKIKPEHEKAQQKEIEKFKPEHEKAQQKEIEKFKAEHEKYPKEFIKEIDKIKPEHEKFHKDVDKVKPEKEIEKVKAEYEKNPKELVKEIDKIKPEFEKGVKEKEGKEIAEGPGDPALSEGVAARGDGDQDHFIQSGQRPDLSGGALTGEADKGKPPRKP
jgi:hypothetical protein